MVKELMHDPIFLAGKSKPATKERIIAGGSNRCLPHQTECIMLRELLIKNGEIVRISLQQ